MTVRVCKTYKMKFFTHEMITPILPSFLPLAATILFTLSINSTKYFMWMNSYRVYSFVTGLFNLVYFFKIHPCQHFLSFYRWIIFRCMFRPHFVYPFISRDIWVVFTFLAIKNNAVMNIGVTIWLSRYFQCFEYKSRTGIVGSYHFVF